MEYIQKLCYLCQERIGDYENYIEICMISAPIKVTYIHASFATAYRNQPGAAYRNGDQEASQPKY